MAIVEARILTIGWDSAAGVFDDSVLRGYLADREVLRAEPQFFVHGGKPYWTVYLETRVLQGAEARPAGADVRQEQRAAALDAVLSELDEVQRARYQRLLEWRRTTAVREGVPPFVLCDNRQAVELARSAPRTFACRIATTTIRRTTTTTSASAVAAHGIARQAVSTDAASVPAPLQSSRHAAFPFQTRSRQFALSLGSWSRTRLRIAVCARSCFHC